MSDDDRIIKEVEETLGELESAIETGSIRQMVADPYAAMLERVKDLKQKVAELRFSREEEERLTAAFEKLADAITTRQERAPSPELAVIGERLEQIAGRTATTQDKRDIHDNFVKLAERMGRGRRVDTGNDPLSVGVPAPESPTLSDPQPIEPTTLFPGGDASIYGTGLDAVDKIDVDGSPARIRRRMSYEVQFTVPDVGPCDDAVINIVLANGDLLTRADGSNLTAEVEGVGYTSQQSTKGRRS